MDGLRRGGVAAVSPRAATLVMLAALIGCDDLQGLDEEVPPLARIEVEVTGELEPLRPAHTLGETPHLRVALVWAAQWSPEPFCVLPPTSDEAALVIEAGCPDNFGFVPERVGPSVAVEPGEPAALELVSLPAADVMIGDVTARIAYGSLVVYDDRDGDGTLELQESRRFGRGDDFDDDDFDDDDDHEDDDIIYGASLVSMTEPDQRVAFREGEFIESLPFYPRAGCPEPPRGFSLLSAGGFSEADAIAAVLRGELPEQDPDTCVEAAIDEATVTIPLQAPDGLRQIGCEGRREDGTTRYDDPPGEDPDLGGRAWACADLPSFGEPAPEGVQQLVVSGLPTDACMRVTHFLLRGCENDPLCEVPEWDVTNDPPAWWPCTSDR